MVRVSLCSIIILILLLTIIPQLLQKKCSMWEDVIREETKRRTDLIDFRLNMNSLIDHTSCYGVNNSVTKQRIGAMKQSCAKLNRKKRAASGK